MKKSRQKGITLIALVITIIVLLILAGVTIATLMGNNGLLTRAQEAKQRTEVSENEEECKRGAELMESWLGEHSQLYTCRDAAYVRRLQRELGSEDGELYFLKDIA